MAVRHLLVEVVSARQAGDDQQTETELDYQYLTGPRFRLRVQAVVEAFSTMQENPDAERRAIMKQWEKRREQLDRVMQATVGMYGDLQGIAGKSLQEIEGLDVGLLDVGSAPSPPKLTWKEAKVSHQPDSSNSRLAARIVEALKAASLLSDKYAASVKQKLSTGKAKESDWRLWAEEIVMMREKADEQAQKN
jgi:hypothetical protein